MRGSTSGEGPSAGRPMRITFGNVEITALAFASSKATCEARGNVSSTVDTSALERTFSSSAT
eukprot:10120917-Prorocentrum_lima.AAC.1